MMSNRTQVLGVFSRLIIYLLGIFSFIYVFRVLNVKNAIIGYFYKEPEVVKISDFEYDFKSLLFKNSGANDNEYFAMANAKAVSNFDKTKKYTVTINGIQANRVYGDYTYINSNFTNNFISTQDTTLLTDTLNIKINFYTEETIIVFTTESGEQAINLWSSYIAKNGFVLKIVEDNYTPQIEADNLLTYTINLYTGSSIYQTITINALSKALPKKIGTDNVEYWQDANGNKYTEAPLKDIDLYAKFYDKFTVNLYVNNELVVTRECDETLNERLPRYLSYKTISKWTDSEGKVYVNYPAKDIDLYGEIGYENLRFNFNNDDILKVGNFDGTINVWSKKTTISEIEEHDSVSLIFIKSVRKYGKLTFKNFYGKDYTFNLTEINFNNHLFNNTNAPDFIEFDETITNSIGFNIGCLFQYDFETKQYGFSIYSNDLPAQLKTDLENNTIPFEIFFEFNILS